MTLGCRLIVTSPVDVIGYSAQRSGMCDGYEADESDQRELHVGVVVEEIGFDAEKLLFVLQKRFPSVFEVSEY